MPIILSGAGGRGGGRGSAAFGGVASFGAQTALTSGLMVYLFSPIVSDHEVIDWQLSASERTLGQNPTKDIWTNSAQTQGIRVTLTNPSGATGNGRRFYQISSDQSGVLRIEYSNQQYSVRGPVPSGYTAAQFKALIDAHGDFTSVYFGGETGTTLLFSLNTSIIFGDTNANITFSGGVNEEATRILIDTTNRLVRPRIRTTDMLGAVKTAIEATAGLGCEYFGGADENTLAARALAWAEPFSLVTVVGGPEGPPGSLTAADQMVLSDAQAAASASAMAAAASATDADDSETDSETAQAAAVAAQTGANTARTGAQAAQTSAETAQAAAETARNGATTAQTEAETAQTEAETAQTEAETAQNAATTARTGSETAQAAAETARNGATTARTGAEAAQAAAEAARDSALAQTGFATAIADAVTGNTETGIDVTYDTGTGKLNFVVSGGGTAPVGDHTRRAAISTDTTLDQAEYDASTSSTTQTVMMPVWSGNRRFLFIGVPEGEGDITGVTTGGINIFHAWERVTGVLFDHKWWRTINDQNDVASGATYQITEA